MILFTGGGSYDCINKIYVKGGEHHMNTNCEINWSGKIENVTDSKTTTKLDYPYVIERMDLSFLNKLLSTNFKPMIWIGIPNQ